MHKSFSTALVLTVILAFASACSRFSASRMPEEMPPSKNSVNKDHRTIENESPSASPKLDNPKIEKADFKMTAEEYIKEFTRQGVTKKDLEKYAGKQIAVIGRVTMFSFEKNGTAPPYVVLSEFDSIRGVTCYLNTTNTEGWKLVRMEKSVTVQGTGEDFPSAGSPPALNRCVVLKAE